MASVLTPETTDRLRKAGFSFPMYEHDCNYGMCFFYKERIRVIGGHWDDPFSPSDVEVAQNGTWLPDEGQLLEWLQLNDFDIKIHWDDSTQYFGILATDTQNNVKYTAGGIDLTNSIAKVIYKICKSKKREYLPQDRLRLTVESDD